MAGEGRVCWIQKGVSSNLLRHSFCFDSKWAVDCDFLVKIGDELAYRQPINLAVLHTQRMINTAGFDEPAKNELPVVIPAEGPINRVGQGH